MREEGALFLVRHGQTAWSRDHRHTGRTDVVLEPEGCDQARRMESVLASHDFALVLSSPLRRAMETCELAGLGSGAEPCLDLVEWDYGAYEGLTTTEIRRERPGWLLWRDGVPGGETAAQVAARADRVIATARAARGDVALFSHGHLLRVLAARWVGLGPEVGAGLALDAGALSILGWDRELAVIQRWNQPVP